MLVLLLVMVMKICWGWEWWGVEGMTSLCVEGEKVSGWDGRREVDVKVKWRGVDRKVAEP